MSFVSHFARPILLSAVILTALAACSSSGSKKSTTKVCKGIASNQYCVQSGDTLTRIAQRHKVSVSDLKTWNNLRSDTIQIGQVLIVRQVAVGNVNQNVARANPSGAIALQMPVAGTLITPYSAANKGLDIAAPRGTLVTAAADGTVIYAGEGVRGYGKLLLIRHSPTTITAYAHNDNLLVAEKANVRAGQIIASVGDSGRVDGRTALHFELRINGKHVNPAAYLR